MLQEVRTRLMWRGGETVAEILRQLPGPAYVELQLAPDYHNALYTHLGGPDLTGEQELDTSDGLDLLARVAEIGGLTELAALLPALAECEVTVRVVSPGPKILLRLPPAGSI